MSCPWSQPAPRHREPRAPWRDSDGFQYSLTQPHILLHLRWSPVKSCISAACIASHCMASLQLCAKGGSSISFKPFSFLIHREHKGIWTGCPSPDHTLPSKQMNTIMNTANAPRSLASSCWAWGIFKQVTFEKCPAGTRFCQRIPSAHTSARDVLHITLSPLLVGAGGCLRYGNMLAGNVLHVCSKVKGIRCRG